MKSRVHALTLIVITSLSLLACGGGGQTSSPAPVTYTIGGTISGLSGAGLILQNNGSDNLPVSTNGSFTFSTPVASGSTYNVTIFLQPSSPAQSCAVTNGSGTANANVSNVQVACTTMQACSGVPNMTIGSVTWSPQWCQEFNGPANLPDTTVWSFDLGNNNGWGNNEVEAYCGPPGYPNNPPQCPTTFSTTTNTVYIDGYGHLVIQPINSNGTWLSTRMKTQGLENFQYGVIEASLQLPNTTDPGLWPAFWSLGSDYPGVPWPNCGEADFMENWSPQVDNGPGPGGSRSTIHTAETDGAGISGAYTFPGGQQTDTAFHTYGVIWSANMMQFYVDNPSAPFFIVTPSDLPRGDTWPFNANIFLLMNVAIGGTLGGPTGGLTNPQPMLADYVRWYTMSPSDAIRAKPALGNPAPIVVNAGATATSKLTPQLAPGTGFVYFTCSVDALAASCEITTSDPLNKHAINSSAEESVTVTITTSRSGTPAGDYSVTVYAFAENNFGNGSKATADASATLPLTVKN
ncbi:MAG: glycoside hydrolase family 16 protein [Candidatus Korobacteraceae bacterium]|jgi:beta-glucanase (GH16 family)